MMQTISNAINWGNAVIGKLVRWLIILMVVGTFANVVWRYVFDQYSIPLNESVIIMNSMVFMLGAAYALQTNQHVRVDVFYAYFSDRKKAMVDLFGTVVFLIPMFVFLLVYSWDYTLASWKVLESSPNTGGLPGFFLVKSIIPLTCGLMILQGLADIITNINKIRGKH